MDLRRIKFLHYRPYFFCLKPLLSFTIQVKHGEVGLNKDNPWLVLTLQAELSPTAFSQELDQKLRSCLKEHQDQLIVELKGPSEELEKNHIKVLIRWSENFQAMGGALKVVGVKPQLVMYLLGVNSENSVTGSPEQAKQDGVGKGNSERKFTSGGQGDLALPVDIFYENWDLLKVALPFVRFEKEMGKDEIEWPTEAMEALGELDLSELSGDGQGRVLSLDNQTQNTQSSVQVPDLHASFLEELQGESINWDEQELSLAEAIAHQTVQGQIKSSENPQIISEEISPKEQNPADYGQNLSINLKEDQENDLIESIKRGFEKNKELAPEPYTDFEGVKSPENLRLPDTQAGFIADIGLELNLKTSEDAQGDIDAKSLSAINTINTLEEELAKQVDEINPLQNPLEEPDKTSESFSVDESEKLLTTFSDKPALSDTSEQAQNQPAEQEPENTSSASQEMRGELLEPLQTGEKESTPDFYNVWGETALESSSSASELETLENETINPELLTFSEEALQKEQSPEYPPANPPAPLSSEPADAQTGLKNQSVLEKSRPIYTEQSSPKTVPAEPLPGVSLVPVLGNRTLHAGWHVCTTCKKGKWMLSSMLLASCSHCGGHSPLLPENLKGANILWMLEKRVY